MMHEKRTPDVIQGFVLFYHHDKLLTLYFNIYIIYTFTALHFSLIIYLVIYRNLTF